MTSKLETSSSSTLLTTKINKLLSDLNKEFAGFETTTKEEVIMSFNEVVRKFYSSLEKPLFNYKEFRQGKLPNISEINGSFILAQQDLQILYEELSSLREKLSSNYNALAAASLQVKSDLSKATSDLLDYKIQNTNRIQPSFIDMFNNLSKIDSDDNSYDKDKAFVDTKNNRVIMPLEEEAEVLKITRIRIAEDSVGNSGNNEEVGVVARDNLQFISDSNVDTWFEFEQVNRKEIVAPTVLSLRIDFEEEKIFNLIEVVPLVLPNGTAPAISSIRGSVDGSTFFDLMPFYQGEITQDSIGTDVIQLNSKDDNPTEENILYFFPKKIKYLSVKFIEDASYFIRTPSGIKNRTAVGIKELKVKAQKFKQKGQIISIDHEANKEISKVAVKSSEVIPDNFDTTLDYFISVDSGRTWDPIGPSQRVSTDKSEVLNYNIDFLEESKRTEVPVSAVKLRVDMEVKTSEDDTTINSAFSRVEKTEFQSIGAGSKTISLEEKPIGGLDIYRVNYGSVGGSGFYRTETSSLTEIEDRILLQLPLSVFPQNSIKEDREVIFADNFTWTRVNDLTTSSATDLHYEFDYINNIVTFNKDDSGTRKGKEPAGDILFKLERENPIFKNLGKQSQVETSLRHDGVKEKIQIYKLNEEILNKTIRIRNNSSVHRLGVTEIDNVTVTQDLNSKLTLEKDYINGVYELTTSGDFSVDKTKGVLYTFESVDSDEDIQVSVDYKTRTSLDFELQEGQVLVDTEAYQPQNKVFDIDIASPTFVVNLGIKNISKGTLQFNTFPAEFETEVSFEEMEEKFEDNDILNAYAVDYREGLIYTKNQTSGQLQGICSAADYFIEYNISYKLPRTSFTVNKDDQQIVFADDYVLDFFADSQVNGLSSPLFKIEYGFADTIDESSIELIKYVTPLLNSYTITTTPKDTIV